MLRTVPHLFCWDLPQFWGDSYIPLGFLHRAALGGLFHPAGPLILAPWPPVPWQPAAAPAELPESRS